MTPELFALSEKCGRKLEAAGWKLATAESCTGGGIAAAVTEIAGSSGWFDRGFVTYTNEAKVQMLGVSEATLATLGAVSEETVLQMSRGALAKSAAHIAVAVSGIAGPSGGSKEKPVGMVCIGWATKAGAEARTFHFAGDRAAVRGQTIATALSGVLERVP